MKRHFTFGKLKTDRGESSLFVLLVVVGIIVFVILPITCFTFERMMINLLYQEIADTLDLNSYQVYQYLDIEELSHKKLLVDARCKDGMQQALDELSLPQILNVEILDMYLTKHESAQLTFQVRLKLAPTLYRSLLLLDDTMEMRYVMNIPLDG